MSVLFGDPGKMLSLPGNGWTDRSSFWTLPEIMTVQRFSHLLGEAREPDAFPLLMIFLKKVPILICKLQTGGSFINTYTSMKIYYLNINVRTGVTVRG